MSDTPVWWLKYFEWHLHCAQSEKKPWKSSFIQSNKDTLTHSYTHTRTHSAALWPQMLMPPLRGPQDSCRLDLFIVGQTMDSTSWRPASFPSSLTHTLFILLHPPHSHTHRMQSCRQRTTCIRHRCMRLQTDPGVHMCVNVISWTCCSDSVMAFECLHSSYLPPLSAGCCVKMCCFFFLVKCRARNVIFFSTYFIYSLLLSLNKACQISHAAFRCSPESKMWSHQKLQILMKGCESIYFFFAFDKCRSSELIFWNICFVCLFCVY